MNMIFNVVGGIQGQFLEVGFLVGRANAYVS